MPLETPSIINSIEKETMEFIGFEGENAVELLKECLRFYEVWDNGDYRAALEKYKTITAKFLLPLARLQCKN